MLELRRIYIYKEFALLILTSLSLLGCDWVEAANKERESMPPYISLYDETHSTVLIGEKENEQLNDLNFFLIKKSE